MRDGYIHVDGGGSPSGSMSTTVALRQAAFLRSDFGTSRRCRDRALVLRTGACRGSLPHSATIPGANSGLSRNGARGWVWRDAAQCQGSCPASHASRIHRPQTVAGHHPRTGKRRSSETSLATRPASGGILRRLAGSCQRQNTIPRFHSLTLV